MKPGARELGWVLLVVLGAWSSSLTFAAFSFDDAEAILDNPLVAGNEPWTRAFGRDYWHHRGDAGHYRPLATVTLAADHRRFGSDGRGYHLTNVLLHLAVCAGAFVVLRALFDGAGRALVFGLLVFAVHPLLADSVAWISGRTSLLSALGGVLGALLLVGAAARAAGPLRTALAFLAGVAGVACGLLGKEDAIVFVLVLPVVAAGLAARSAGAHAGRFATACALGSVVGLVLVALARASALGSILPSAPHAPLADNTLGERLVFGGRALVEGLLLAVWPLHFPPSYRSVPGFTTSAPPSLLFLAGWLPWCATLGAGALAFVRARRGSLGRAVAASAVLAALALLPGLQLVPAGEVFAPRFLYLPLLLAVPVLAALGRRLGAGLPGPTASFALGAILVLSLAGLSFRRATVYADRGSHAAAILAHVPGDVGAWNDLGLARYEAGDVAGARTLWSRASRLDPSYGRVWSNLGRLALEGGDLEDAERSFRRAAAAGRNPIAFCNLGATLLRLERPHEAALAYARAAELAPGLLPAWRGWANALGVQGEWLAADAKLARALELDGTDPGALSLERRLRAAVRTGVPNER